jgi:hypothetical protein
VPRRRSRQPPGEPRPEEWEAKIGENDVGIVDGDGDGGQRTTDLEEIVAKRKRDSYSRQTVSYKVKNPAYT